MFQEIIADSDSEDDIPLAELRPLVHSRLPAQNKDGSTRCTSSRDPDDDVNNGNVNNEIKMYL